MKMLLFFLLAKAVLLQSCSEPVIQSEDRNFSSLNDTIELEAHRIKGPGLFSIGAGYLMLEDTNQLFSYPVKYPTGISEVRGAHVSTDFRDFDEDYVDVLVGQIDDSDVYIVDQNDNQDFTDDSVRILQPIDWTSSRNSVETIVRVYSGTSIVQDTSWVRIALSNDNILYSRDEHLEARLSFNNHEYTLGLIDIPFVATFRYGGDPQIAIQSIDSIYKDSVSPGELYSLGEYILLDTTYYRFDSLSQDGSQVILVKEEHFNEKYGTQVGMLAPEFTSVSITGDTLESSILSVKPSVIANSCGCGGDIESVQAVNDLKGKYGSKIHILHLDHRLRESNADWVIDMSDSFNDEVNRVYRKQYCSRTAYIIGVDNRVLDKFNIRDWKATLSDILDD